MSNAIGWVVIGAIALAYVNQPAAQVVTHTKYGGDVWRFPDEVDPTRWRHDGSQPVYYTKGNAAHFMDAKVQELVMEGA